MVDDASLRMLAEETGVPLWVCRLALEAAAPDEPHEDPVAEDFLLAGLPPKPVAPPPASR